MPKTIAAGFPTNLATCSSNSVCIIVVPVLANNDLYEEGSPPYSKKIHMRNLPTSINSATTSACGKNFQTLNCPRRTIFIKCSKTKIIIWSQVEAPRHIFRPPAQFEFLLIEKMKKKVFKYVLLPLKYMSFIKEKAPK